MDELDVPTLIYETDIFDPRVTSAEQTVRIWYLSELWMLGRRASPLG